MCKPASVFFSPSLVPFGVSISCRSCAATPCFLAKPEAAGVQLPSLSLARSIGGPSTSISLSSPCVCTCAICTARRRGDANQLTSPKPSSRCFKPAVMPSRKARPSDFNALGGSSSVPSSISRVSLLMIAPPPEFAPVLPCGYPLPPRGNPARREH